MMRMICEIVCPGVLLLGEVVMAPEKVVPYFGTLEKPECHILYNVTTMQAPGTQLQPKMYLCSADSWIFWDLFQKNTSSRIICVATMILAGDWIMIS